MKSPGYLLAMYFAEYWRKPSVNSEIANCVNSLFCLESQKNFAALL